MGAKCHCGLAVMLCLATSQGIGAQATKTASAPAPNSSTDSLHSNESYVFEKIERKVSFEPDGKGQRDLTFRVRIQSESAVRQFGLIVYPFASSFESLDVLYVRVLKANGEIVETPLSEVQEIDTAVSRAAPMYTDEREKHIAVKSLAVGDVLEANLRWTIHDPIVPGHFWFDHSFFRSGICLQETLQIDVPASVPLKLRNSDPQPIVREENGRRVYTFQSSNLKKPEASKIPEWERNFHGAPPPDIQLSSFSSWQQIAEWFASLEQPKIALTPEICQKAEELTKGKSTEDGKLHALYELVSARFRYIGVDLGKGRYTPHAAPEVLANGYGDCKDKHTLFSALLQAVGVSSYPVLVSSKYRVDPSFPTISLFDHVITAIPRGETFLFLDTTPEVAAFGLLAPNIRNRKALVVSSSKSTRLVATPADPPFPSVERFQVESSIDKDGTLEAKIRLEDRGDAELALRLVYRASPQNHWDELTQRLMTGMGFGGAVTNVSTARPEDSSKPFWIDFSYRRTDYADWRDHRVALPTPPLFLHSLNEEQKLSKEPLPLGPLQDITYEVSMSFPQGYSPLVPQKEVEQKNDFAEFTATYQVDKSIVRGTFHLKTLLHEVPAVQRAEYSRFSKRVEDTMRRYILVGGDLSAANPASSLSSVQPGRTTEPKSVTIVHPPNSALPDGGSAESPETPLKPHIAQALYEAARRAESNGDYAGGARILEQVVEKDPKHKQAWNYLGWTYNKLGKYEKAEAALRTAIELNPADRAAYNNLGNALTGQKKYEEAIPQFQKQIEINPKDRWAHANLGRTYVITHQYEKAVPELETAASITPDDPAVYFNLGRAYGNLGQTEKAVKQFERSVDLEPIPSRWNAVAYEMALEKLQLDEAQKYAELAIEGTVAQTKELSLDRLSNEDVRLPAALGAYWDTLGWVKFQEGNLSEAEKYARSAWQLRSIGEIGDHLGQVYEKEGRNKEAIEAYSQALAAVGPMPETKGRLTALLGANDNVDHVMEEGQSKFTNSRTIQVRNVHDADGRAEFWVLLVLGPKVKAVTFISGEEALRSFTTELEALTFSESFPDTREVILLRRGRLTCHRTSEACSFVLASAETVRSTYLVVVFLPQVRNQILAHHPAQRVLQLHRLDEQIMLGIQARCGHRGFEVEAQPFLDAAHSGALCQVEEQNQVEHDGRC